MFRDQYHILPSTLYRGVQPASPLLTSLTSERARVGPLWTTPTELPVPHDPSPTTLQATERRMGRVTDMASTFIGRAGKCSMALHLGARDHNSPFDLLEYTMTIEPFASALRQARWKVLDFNLQFYQPSSPLLQILGLTRSSGTLVGARILLHADSFDNIAGHLDLMSATQLTSLGPGIPEGTLHYSKINWRPLTELSLYGEVWPLQALGVLSKSPNLVKCTIEFPNKRSLSYGGPVRSVLPHLETPTISGFPSYDFHKCLTLPSLRTLALVDKMEIYTAYFGPPPIDPLPPDWTSLHGTQLAHLAFSYGRIRLSDFLSCLEGVPNLLSIEIQPAIMPQITTLPPAGGRREMHFPLATLLALTPSFDETGERLPSLARAPSSGGSPHSGRLSKRRLNIGWSSLHPDVVRLRPASDTWRVWMFWFQDLDATFVSTMWEGTSKLLRQRGVSLDGISFRYH
ncbi:hypothetical protein FA13DRAFT_1802686 [Coprinellus micaceus]|uniref:F-box domain-containing protein n=1 Tax=Coprinellus micaceus TaxID=71717 RepID=A0A4Y7SCB3_COPMI|nr:hypothetical protein FA13DRAFT_1802686 [Coprinellus micaceus]